MPGYATLRRLYFTAVFLLPVALAAASSAAGPPGEQATVQGSLTNPADEPVEGRPVALVADGDTLDTATSGSDGSFAFTYTYRAEGREDMRDLPYPNPSGGGLRWEFDAGQAGALQITVYDVQGRRVYTASDEAGESGLHELRMQGVPGADGLYIIRVAGSGFAAETSFTAIGGSGIATAGVDDLSEIAGAEAAPEEFVIAGEGGEQYEDLTEPVPFGRDVDMTLELQDRYFTVNSSGRALDEDGGDADASVVKSYAGSSEEFDFTGSFDLGFRIPKRLLGEGGLKYEFSGFGLEDKSLERDVSESVDLGDVSLDYKPEVSTSSEKVEWFEGDVDVGVSSLQDLESIVLSVEGESYSKDVSGMGGSVSFSHSFEEDGDVPYTVTVVDEAGREYDVSDSVDVAERHSFEVSSEGFFANMGEDPYWGYDVGEDVNYEASITARHLDTGKDTTLTVDGNGIMAADLPGGVYGLDLDGGGPESLEEDSNGWSQLSRLRVSRDQVDWYQSYWHGGDSTYVVSGYDYSDQEAYVMHDTGFTSTMETVEDFMYEDIGETFMSALSRAMYVHRSRRPGNFEEVDTSDRDNWPNMMIVPNVADENGSVVTHKVVLNTGNEDYDEHWNASARDDDGNRYYPDDGENPPGSMISEEGWENYEVFKEDLENVFDYSTGGSTNESVGRPFNVEYVEDTAENLHDYLVSWGGDVNPLRPENDVLFIGLHDGPGGVENRSINLSTPPPRDMSWSFQYVNDMDASRFTSENNYFFSTRGDWGNVNPGICSVSDFNTSFFVNPDPPGYCTERLKTKPDEDGVRRSINPIDWWIHTTVSGFAPFAQSQFNYNFTEEIVNSSDVEVVRGHLQGDSFDTVFSTYTGFNIKLPEPDREREFEW